VQVALPGAEAPAVVLEDVECSPGQLPSLSGPYLNFHAEAAHTDAAAAETMRALFPQVQPTTDTVVCMGPMALDLAAAQASGVPGSAAPPVPPPHHHH
jgi:hypothetical protein